MQKTIIYYLSDNEAYYLIQKHSGKDEWEIIDTIDDTKLLLDDYFTQKLSYEASGESYEYKLAQITTDQLDDLESDDIKNYKISEIAALSINNLDWLALTAADSYIKEGIDW